MFKTTEYRYLEAAEEIEKILLENGALENPTQQLGTQRTWF